MDNVTHTLAGLVVADVAIQLRALLRSRLKRRARPSDDGAVVDNWERDRFRGALFTASALANNGPDFDFLYTGITGGKLGYLLHHRGHTHTLAAAPILALVCWASVSLALRLMGSKLDRARNQSLFGIALVGSVLHVLMDFSNNYGVHPFWPVNSGWFYGDSVFIVEPWLLLILAGAALGAAASRALRGVLAFCVGALLVIAWRSDLAGVGLASTLSVFAVVWCLALWRAPPRWRLVSTSVALAAFWLAFLVARHQVRAIAPRALAAGRELVSLSSTPSPGNPLCWWIVGVSVEGDDYVVRQALAAAWPKLLGVDQCSWPSRSGTAPLRMPASGTLEAAPVGVVRGPEFRAPLSHLRSAAQGDCTVRAFLRFARVPFWVEEGGRLSIIGDLRYDRSRSIDFAELVLDPSAPCPRFEPPWQPPLPLLGP